MAPDPRIAWVSPVWRARQQALSHWRTAPPEVRLAWAACPADFTRHDPDELQVDWQKLWQAEHDLAAAVRADRGWEELVPDDWEARELFLDAFEGLPDAERSALGGTARRWLDTLPYSAWLAPPRGGARSEEFAREELGIPDHLNDLWVRLRNLRVDLTPRVSAALNVLARVDEASFVDLLVTLPPVLLWVVAERRDDPELLLSLSRSGQAVAASYGAWRYREYLVALEGYGNVLIRQLNPFQSSRREVGEALTRHESVRRELERRAADLVVELGGGQQRPVLLARLMQTAVAHADSWADMFLAEAAAKELGELSRATPELSATITATLASDDRAGPLPAVLLVSNPATPDEQVRWRTLVLEHLTRRLKLPAEESDPLGPLSFDSEKSTVRYAGLLIATWLEEAPDHATAWFAERFADLPVRASRQEPRSWLFGKRAAFLCILAAETLARVMKQSGGLHLQALLARELETRAPEWEWTNGLGERTLDEWPGIAVVGCRSHLNAEQRERIADASRSLWVLVQLLDDEQLACREAVLAARLETDLYTVTSQVLAPLETRFARLQRWSELAACRSRRQVLNAREGAHVRSELYSSMLDNLAQYGQRGSEALSAALTWRVGMVTRSHAHDAFQTYALIIRVLRDVTGEPEWRHAVADVEGWCRVVLEAPFP